MRSLIRILLVEDNPDDALLLRVICRNRPDCPLDIRHVGTLADANQALEQDGENIDVVLLDLTLPDSAPAETLARAKLIARTVPVVILTYVQDNLVAENAIFGGVQDYLVKGQFDFQALDRSIRYAIERRRAAQEKDRLLAELRATLDQVKQLQGFLPICASCKKIRDDKGYWAEVEHYIHDHSEAKFTHSICPDCSRRLYPELFANKPKA